MFSRMQSGNPEIFPLMVELVKELRCCCRNDAFCGGVSFTQFIILDRMVEVEKMNMADLHRFLSVEKSTTTRLVAPLVKQKLLCRDTSCHDSRAVTLSLMERGKAIHKQVWRNIESFLKAIYAEIPPEKKDSCLAGCRVFLEALQSAYAMRTEHKKNMDCCKSC